MDPKEQHRLMLDKAIEFIESETKETINAVRDLKTHLNKDETISDHTFSEVIDGFGDVAFLALNGIYKAFRLRGHEPAFSRDMVVEVMHRICNANLQKKDPISKQVVFVENKVQKPIGWEAPTYKDLCSIPPSA